MAKKGYTVNWLLNHNQKTFKKDDTVQLEEKEAKALLFLGVISAIEQSEKAKPEEKPEEKPEHIK
jgi:hypothetical protein